MLSQRKLGQDVMSFRGVVRPLLSEMNMAILSRDVQGNLLFHLGVEPLFGYPIELFKHDPFFVDTLVNKSTLTARTGDKPNDSWWSPEFSKGQPVTVDFEIRHGDGKLHWIRYHVRPVHDEHGHILRHDAIAMDVTDEKREEIELRYSEARFQMLIEKSPVGIILWQGDQIHYANPAAAKLWGVNDAHTLIKTSINRLFTETVNLEVQKFGAGLSCAGKEENSPPIQCHCVRNDGTSFVSEIIHCPIEFAQGPVVMTMVKDVTEHYELRKALEHMAYEDPVTGLANRRKFFETLSMLIENVASSGPTRVGVAYIDLDRFKDINDKWGHLFGDEVLIEVSKRLRTIVSKHVLLARLGGDEFAFLMEGATKADVAEIASVILEKLALPVVVKDITVNVAPSVGIAFFPDDASTFGEVLQYADRAMYEAKRQGGNQTQFYSER